jgi:hypothetical protein
MGGKTVDELVAEYKKMVKTGKVVAPFAAANLEHWLGNTGTTRKVSVSHFKTESNVVDHLKDTHRAIFLSKKSLTKGLVPRIKKNPGPATYKMTWEDSMYAKYLTDLYFALGGFTLRSKVEVTVTPTKADPKTYDVVFDSWESQAYDDYNWDHGKSVYIPGWGKIDDKEAIRVEKAGKAKSFAVESDWWKVTNTSIAGKAQIKI